jgi:hypothetical protein
MQTMIGVSLCVMCKRLGLANLHWRPTTSCAWIDRSYTPALGKVWVVMLALVLPHHLHMRASTCLRSPT